MEDSGLGWGRSAHPAALARDEVFGVLAIGIVGAVIARFQPHGMARALVAAAIAQGLVFLIALIAGLGFTGPITVFFATLWLISAWLFQKAAAREQTPLGAAQDAP